MAAEHRSSELVDLDALSDAILKDLQGSIESLKKPAPRRHAQAVRPVVVLPGEEISLDDLKGIMPSGVSCCIDTTKQRFLGWTLASEFGLKMQRSAAWVEHTKIGAAAVLICKM